MQTRGKKTAVRSQKGRQPDDPEQSQRFLEAARKAEADETAKAVKAFKSVVKPRKPK
jgi:hypothetical protein